jgi:7-cyano-7-deazaguanine reductase
VEFSPAGCGAYAAVILPIGGTGLPASGAASEVLMPDAKLLATFPNPHPDRDYVIEHVAEEFTSVCPITGQPDFGRISIEYVADQLCVELKSLKLYLQSYRNEGIYYEDVTNRILQDLLDQLRPRWMQVRSEWTPRGGIHSNIVAATGPRPQGLL